MKDNKKKSLLGRKGKVIAILAAVVLLIGAVVGGTLAYFTDRENAVNTFTVGNVKIDLTETTSDYQMVPGTDIAKDPIVTVEGDSEACWLFIQIEESENYEDYLSDYVLAKDEEADIWTPLEGVSGVYYRAVPKSESGEAQTFPILKDNKVHVLDSVTKEMMKTLEDSSVDKPTLTFKAYAVQKAGVSTVAEAWAIVNPTE